tara:strand:+ start:10356 stop:10607 length:252 start_codon:yes stop_codon:yes gene_type:complete
MYKYYVRDKNSNNYEEITILTDKPYEDNKVFCIDWANTAFKDEFGYLPQEYEFLTEKEWIVRNNKDYDKKKDEVDKAFRKLFE